jgi:Ca2+/Na+ antiporter
MYPVWLLETIVVGILWTVVMLLAVNNVFSRIWIAVCLVNFLLLFFYKSGMEMKNHGGINRTVLTITIVVLLLLYSMVKGLRKLWQVSIKLFVCLFFGILLSVFIFYQLRVKDSCKGWQNGLGGHKLINSESNCKVPIPTL